MATLADFEIVRVSPDDVSSVHDAKKLVAVYRATTGDGIYKALEEQFAQQFKDIVDSGSGIFQVARLRNDENGPVVAIAFLKLRFKGLRQPELDFAATARQTDLCRKIFGTGSGDHRTISREFVGDPVLTCYEQSLSANGHEFPELSEDLLSELSTEAISLCALTDVTKIVLVLEPIYILPKYQHVEGLARAIVQPVIDRAVSNNVNIIAYSRVNYHEYSHPQKISPSLQIKYPDTDITIHLDTKETPEWKGPEIVWDCRFQLFSTKPVA